MWRINSGSEIHGASVWSNAVALARDDRGDALVEYAIVFTVFTLFVLASVQIVGSAANTAVDIDETNFSQSMVVGG